ncbi:2OG-Fe(II) oxygenase [Sulfitobacter sp. TSTF-M16]|uniref:2OG-Fe(II) oxygenase n=1 Tax=Sulfitobacter aestuariivivens TaxID=2766981 RepID=A0A927D2S0_9RHOB|nr:2OG-Fe(II) oxygenase [Sulfitobacter aestuariivivens]
MSLSKIVDLATHQIRDSTYQQAGADTLDREGVLVLKDFILPNALAAMVIEAREGRKSAYFCAQNHSVYLTPPDDRFAAEHPANRQVVSSKGCICDDHIAANSPLRLLYDHPDFRGFVSGVTGQTALHPYADPLSSINIHYAERGQELGWHFDNSSFAITLLIQKPDAGAHFEYVQNLRDSVAGEMNYDGVADVLDGRAQPKVLTMEPGTLVLFRGRNSLHRVSPNESDRTRMLAVLAYNDAPGVALSESARQTFYGRLD